MIHVSKLRFTFRYSRLGKLYYKIKHVVPATWSYFLHVCEHDDYDWDYSYLVELMRWKLVKMADTIEKNQIIERTDEVVGEIRHAIALIDRYNNADDQEMKLYHEKYGHAKHSFEPGPSPNTQRLVVAYPSQEAEDEFIPAVHRGHRKAQDAKYKLFRHLAKRMEGWWD